MFAKGPVPGLTPRQDALELLPVGKRCTKVTRMGITGYMVELPSGQSIASAGNAQQAWEKARDWALRQKERGSVL